MQVYKMFFLKIAFLLNTLGLYRAAFVDTLPKCDYKDDECLKKLLEKTIIDVAKTGIPEYDVPPVDPLQLSNVSLTVLDSLALTITDGTVKGIKGCTINSFHVDFEKHAGSQSVTCDLTIKGHFKLAGSSPTLQGFFGSSSIGGDGKAKVKLEKVTLNVDFPLHVIKKDDGETYLKFDFKDVKYTYDIGNALFAAEKIIIGNEDISALVVSYMNDNWRSVLKTFGKVFVDKSMEYYFNFVTRIFDQIPTKHFFTNDLSSYV
ncbi:unnamed protein product [Danaus chrysippus]|uniref:(African queen) hypothetical protein n=1 Tax=Danaus chrysippus TaxID=151541 RepID=A0A8J2W0F9_9NEOP|nr:unnamed protein product [Danaus chrysippus]